ncbi:MAG: glycosyltransferase [Candidatus Scalindua sp.]|jgi:glycosyltransferase involved in cell wall biosynthesis|nr:glycosyltransferase [Candidatus Scalindua sp.]
MNNVEEGERLFAEGKIDEAEQYFLSLAERGLNAKGAYNNLGVIAFQRNEKERAIEYFSKSLGIDPYYKDAILNYSDLLRSINQLHLARPLLENMVKKYPDDEGSIKLLDDIRTNNYVKLKITFICPPGQESFLQDIIRYFGARHEVRTCYTNTESEVLLNVEWADTVWFEWADVLAVSLTNHPKGILDDKHVICRLHSGESFTNLPKQINWSVVDNVIFIAEHIRKINELLTPAIKNTTMANIPNGINLDNWKFRTREKGFDIAYVGSINYKKGSILLPHLLNAVLNEDKRYRLHMAGEIQDPRYSFYFKQMVQDMGLSNSFIMYGNIDDIDTWLEDKNYIISASLLESQQLGICEAMAKGIKPVIHNFVGARSLYPEKYIWNSIPDFVRLVQKDDYDSMEYRDFISNTFSLEKQLDAIENVINKCGAETQKV